MQRTIVLTLLTMLISSPALAVDFVPFSKVEDVCPECPKKAEDVITLSNGIKIKAKVVAENSSFLVLSRYGELRMVPQSRVQSVDWSNGSKMNNMTSQDQLVLLSGHVLTGSILEDKTEPVAYFRLQSSVNNQTFVIFKSQVKEAYKSGKPHTIER